MHLFNGPGWVNAFWHGASDEIVVGGFVGSTEHFLRHYNNIRDRLFGAYQNTRGHPAHPAGYDQGVAFLTSDK